MTPKQSWKMLGIAPTSDKRAIKKAYAAKLKSIDPDKDPKAFLELREALDRATWESAYVENSETYAEDIEALEPDFQPAEGEDYPLSGFAEDLITPIRDGEAPSDFQPLPEQHSPNFTPEDEEGDDGDEGDYTPYDGTDPELAKDHPRNRLANILWGDEPLTAALEDEARLLYTQIISDPKMDEIDHGTQMEDWFGWMINQTMRRSDCILPWAVEHFKWRDKLGGIHTPWFAEAIVGRARDLRRLIALQNPAHHGHAAFRRLAEPHPGPLTQLEKVRFKGDTLTLLSSIRSKFPTLEWDMDAETVALWQPLLEKQDASIAATGGKGTSWWRIGFFIYAILALIGFVFGGNDTPKPNGPNMADVLIYPEGITPPPAYVTLEESTKTAIRMLATDDLIRSQKKLEQKQVEIGKPPRADLPAEPLFSDAARPVVMEQVRKEIAEATRKAQSKMPAPSPTQPEIAEQYLPKTPAAPPPLPPAEIKSSLDEMSPEERKKLMERVRQALEETNKQ
jgi:hypothetical protein